MPSAYCGECEWKYRTERDDAGELSRAMIGHFVETGHSPVERCDTTNHPSIADPLEPVDRTVARTRDQ